MHRAVGVPGMVMVPIVGVRYDGQSSHAHKHCDANKKHRGNRFFHYSSLYVLSLDAEYPTSPNKHPSRSDKKADAVRVRSVTPPTLLP